MVENEMKDADYGKFLNQEEMNSQLKQLRQMVDLLNKKVEDLFHQVRSNTAAIQDIQQKRIQRPKEEEKQEIEAKAQKERNQEKNGVTHHQHQILKKVSRGIFKVVENQENEQLETQKPENNSPDRHEPMVIQGIFLYEKPFILGEKNYEKCINQCERVNLVSLGEGVQFKIFGIGVQEKPKSEFSWERSKEEIQCMVKIFDPGPKLEFKRLINATNSEINSQQIQPISFKAFLQTVRDQETQELQHFTNVVRLCLRVFKILDSQIRYQGRRTFTVVLVQCHGQCSFEAIWEEPYWFRLACLDFDIVVKVDLGQEGNCNETSNRTTGEQKDRSRPTISKTTKECREEMQTENQSISGNGERDEKEESVIMVIDTKLGESIYKPRGEVTKEPSDHQVVSNPTSAIFNVGL